MKSDSIEGGGVDREEGRHPKSPVGGGKATVIGYTRDKYGVWINNENAGGWEVGIIEGMQS